MGGGDSCDFFLLLFFPFFGIAPGMHHANFDSSPEKKGEKMPINGKKVCIRETAFDILAEFKTRGFFGKKRTFYFLSFFSLFAKVFCGRPCENGKKIPLAKKGRRP